MFGLRNKIINFYYALVSKNLPIAVKKQQQSYKQKIILNILSNQMFWVF